MFAQSWLSYWLRDFEERAEGSDSSEPLDGGSWGVERGGMRGMLAGQVGDDEATMSALERRRQSLAWQLQRTQHMINRALGEGTPSQEAPKGADAAQRGVEPDLALTAPQNALWPTPRPTWASFRPCIHLHLTRGLQVTQGPWALRVSPPRGDAPSPPTRLTDTPAHAATAPRASLRALYCMQRLRWTASLHWFPKLALKPRSKLDLMI